MGAIFAERVLGVEDPRVALLSIGEEKGKGDARIRQPNCSIGSTLRFVGNVEGRDLENHKADVVVTDAVAGNVVMKFFEGLSTFIFDLWRPNSGASAVARLPPDATGDPPHPRRLRRRDPGRLAAAGCQGDRHHHARQRKAADDRVRLRGRGPDGRARVPDLIAEALAEEQSPEMAADPGSAALNDAAGRR